MARIAIRRRSLGRRCPEADRKEATGEDSVDHLGRQTLWPGRAATEDTAQDGTSDPIPSGGQATGLTGRHHYVFSLAQDLDFPLLPFGFNPREDQPYKALARGNDAWRRFRQRTRDHDLGLALAALEHLAEEEATPCPGGGIGRC